MDNPMPDFSFRVIAGMFSLGNTEVVNHQIRYP